MKVLITGSSGYIGSHLAHTFDLRKQRIDVENDIMNSEIEKSSYDLIFHLAFISSPRNNDIDTLLHNIEITQKAISWLRPEGTFMFASSGAVYGEVKKTTEDSAVIPITNYAIAKYLCEELIKKHIKNYYIFRLANVFGSRFLEVAEPGIVSVIKKCLKERDTLMLLNKGKTYRDYIYIDDVINAFFNPSLSRGIYNVSSNKAYKILDLVRKSGVDYDYGGDAKEPKKSQLDNTKLMSKGWKPTLDIISYIKEGKKEWIL